MASRVPAGRPGPSLQAQREQANRRGAARLDERQRRQEQKRLEEQGDIASAGLTRKREREDSGGEAGPVSDEYGSLRLGSRARTFVSTAGQHGFTCVLCNVTLPSQELYQQHLAGPSHAKAVRAQAKEEDRRRRGIGAAHDAVAAAQWTVNTADAPVKRYTSNIGGAAASIGGDRSVHPTRSSRNAGEEAAAAPNDDHAEPALPKHISSHRRRAGADLDLSIDGWVPPLPNVAEIDESVVVGSVQAVAAARPGAAHTGPPLAQTTAQDKIESGYGGLKVATEAVAPAADADDIGGPPLKPFALVDYGSDSDESD